MFEQSSLPEPAPLARMALLKFQWGHTEFESLCTGCSIRTLGVGDWQEPITWLHCRAMRTAEVEPDDTSNFMNVLIPAHYVTCFGPGPTYRQQRPEPLLGGLRVFPANQPTPDNHFDLEQIEESLVELLDATVN
jgi:hypothetical protein